MTALNKSPVFILAKSIGEILFSLTLPCGVCLLVFYFGKHVFRNASAVPELLNAAASFM